MPVAALISYELVETWRCGHCGRKFKRRVPLSTPASRGAPAGYGVHARACNRKAARFMLDDEPRAPIDGDDDGTTPGET